jgi:RimJ/RimL family protein N-acetyltransferase
MISGVLKFGFDGLGLNRIGLGVFDFNKQAIKCYKNMGFKPEGTLRQTAKVGDSFWSCNMMSILSKEWPDVHADRHRANIANIKTLVDVRPAR